MEYQPQKQPPTQIELFDKEGNPTIQKEASEGEIEKNDINLDSEKLMEKYWGKDWRKTMKTVDDDKDTEYHKGQH